jgi:hypothetical protein
MVRVACVEFSRAEVTHWKGLEQTPLEVLAVMQGGHGRSQMVFTDADLTKKVLANAECQ